MTWVDAEPIIQGVAPTGFLKPSLPIPNLIEVEIFSSAVLKFLLSRDTKVRIGNGLDTPFGLKMAREVIFIAQTARRCRTSKHI
jgi:hypothetical protein